MLITWNVVEWAFCKTLEWFTKNTPGNGSHAWNLRQCSRTKWNNCKKVYFLRFRFITQHNYVFIARFNKNFHKNEKAGELTKGCTLKNTLADFYRCCFSYTYISNIPMSRTAILHSSCNCYIIFSPYHFYFGDSEVLNGPLVHGNMLFLKMNALVPNVRQ